MIADDNAEMRNFLKSILQGAGVEFVECRDGGEAMACFAAQRPEWTVMDVWMKPVDGFTATRDILARFPGSRILIITQDDNPRLKTEARAAGACGFITAGNGVPPNATQNFTLTVAEALSLTVTTASDVMNNTDNQTSLREAIVYANSLSGAQTITIPPGLGVITLSGDLPILTNPGGITINGNGNTIDGGSTSNTTGFRVFFVGVAPGEAAAATGYGSLVATTGTNWAINNLTIRNANARGGSGGGGGAGLGGGIFVNAGHLSVSGVSFSNNRAIGGNGGVNPQGGGGMGGNGGSTVPGGGGGGFGIAEGDVAGGGDLTPASV